jgi:hypothetical protein
MSAFLISSMFVFTEDVRNDLSRFWELLTHRIPRLRRCNAVPPSSPLREASDHGSHAHRMTTLVVDISAVKRQSGGSSSTFEPVPGS